MQRAVVARELDRAPFGREVAVEDGDAAPRLQRSLDRDDHGLALRLDGGVGDLADRAPVDRPGIRVQEPGLLELAGDERDAARAIHVVRVQRPHGFMSATIGVCAEIRSKSSIVNSIPKSRAIATRWSTAFVDPPVAATEATAFSNDSRVTRERGVTLSRTSCTARRPIS